MSYEISEYHIQSFRENLSENEKACATIEKYVRDVTSFFVWLNGSQTDKSVTLKYKEYLKENYKTRSVNSMISSLNSFFEYMKWYDCKIKTVKVQRESFYDDSRELSKSEYDRLLSAAHSEGNQSLSLIMQTICSCGLRISELKYVTADAVLKGKCEVDSKAKRRTVILPDNLCRLLRAYISKHKIKSGSVFLSKKGKPISRGAVWLSMKRLCKRANVDENKVFPHNLRHLFARTYYTLEKDIVRLADILGHSSVNTTRIYTLESGKIHRQQIQRLGLVHLRV